MITKAEMREVYRKAAERYGMKYVRSSINDILRGQSALLALGRFGPTPPAKPATTDFKDAGANI